MSEFLEIRGRAESRLKWMDKARWCLKDLSEQLNFQTVIAKKTRSSYWTQNIWLYLIGLWSRKCILELCSMGSQKISHDSSLASVSQESTGGKVPDNKTAKCTWSLLREGSIFDFSQPRGNLQAVLSQPLPVSLTCLNVVVGLLTSWALGFHSHEWNPSRNEHPIYLWLSSHMPMTLSKIPFCSFFSLFFGGGHR